MIEIDQYRAPETDAFFEYRCYEGHDSADAQLWYRSHQRVIVLECVNAGDCGNTSMKQSERYECCCPLVYRIRFPDGFEGDAFEDELLHSEAEYQRPDPPNSTARSAGGSTLQGSQAVSP